MQINKVKMCQNQNLLKFNNDESSLTMMSTVNTEFSFVEVWFTDQTSKALEIEDNVKLTLIIGQTLRVSKTLAASNI